MSNAPLSKYIYLKVNFHGAGYLSERILSRKTSQNVMFWLQHGILPSTATNCFTCNLLVPPPSTKHFPAYHSWLNLMFLSVLFCTLCFLDPNSRSIPASSTLYHLLPACCSILCYIAVFPLLLIQAKSPNPYSHLLRFGSSYKLPVSSNLLPISQRTSTHF